MKLNKNFVLRDIAGEVMLVPIGKEAANIGGFIALNDVGALIVKKLSEGCERADLIKAVTDEFEIDESTAERDTDIFIAALNEKNIIDN